MDNELSIQSMAHYFEEIIHRQDEERMGGHSGNAPEFPLMVVFLGQEAIKGFSHIAKGLFRNWPQYREEILFIAITGDEKEMYLEILKEEKQSVRRARVSEERVSEEVGYLFGSKKHFHDKSKLLVYYVMDTTAWNKPDDFRQWTEMLGRFRSSTGVPAARMKDMQIILLNENGLRHQRIANEIRNDLCDVGKRACDTTYLISNQRQDFQIIEDWEPCYRIITCVINVSNNNDIYMVQSLFYRGILTLGYSNEEKPVESIGQIMVTNIVNELKAQKDERPKSIMLDREALSKKLGRNPVDGTFSMLNEYVDRELVKMLPQAEQLSLFPLLEEDEMIDLSSLTTAELNYITGDTWDCYLKSILQNVREKIEVDAMVKKKWEEKMRHRLQDNFNNEEQIELKRNISEIQDWFRKVERNPDDDNSPALISAVNYLKYLLSSDEALQDMFLDQIRRQGEKAEAFSDGWRKLCNSENQMFRIHDDMLKDFYNKKLTSYFDKNRAEIVRDFKSIQSEEELKSFLTKTLDNICRSDDIYSEPFEVELRKRMDSAEVKESFEYIRTILSGVKVVPYLQVNFGLNAPILSIILMNTNERRENGESLYMYLKNNLSYDTRYYNTGNSNAAEALDIYVVKKENLLNGSIR